MRLARSGFAEWRPLCRSELRIAVKKCRFPNKLFRQYRVASAD